MCVSHVHEWPLAYDTTHKAFVKMKHVSKSQRIKDRQLRNRSKALWFRRDLFDPQLIWLRNGTPLRQPLPDVPLYISQQGIVYTLTRFGLRPLKTNFWKKNHYCWRTRNGNRQGQVYPYIKFRNVTYRIHELMALAWLHAKSNDEAIDHINGDIENCDIINLRVISKAENSRCGGLLKRLRNAAIRLNEPRLNPLNIPQERLLEIYKTVPIPKRGKIKDSVFLAFIEK